jgi:hypothetical protein
MAETKFQRLIIALPVAEYERVAREAAQQTRQPEQQILHYVRRAMSRVPKTEEQAAK